MSESAGFRPYIRLTFVSRFIDLLPVGSILIAYSIIAVVIIIIIILL